MMDQRIQKYLEGCHAIGYAPTFFFDMDGVLCNFVFGCCLLMKQDYHKLISKWPKGAYSLRDLPGFANLDDAINETGPEFWHKLQPLDSGCEALIQIAPYANVAILTDPGKFKYAQHGKNLWINQWLGNIEHRVFTKQKFLLAQPGRFLIDDHHLNCQEWESHGGTAILWPQPWNRA